MILTDRTIMVNGNTSSLDSKVYLYRGDKNIQINFSVVNSKFRFTKKAEDNLLKSSDATYSVVRMIAPNGKQITFSEQPIENGQATWLIEEELIDDVDELGSYDIQIRLLNSDKDSIITIPPVMKQIEVLEPIFMEEVSDIVGQGKVNSIRVSPYSGVQRDTLLPDGNYNKKDWVDDEVIYKEDLNTLEDITYKNREKILQQDKEIDKIPTKTVVEDGKLFLAKEDGIKIDLGTELPKGVYIGSKDDAPLSADIVIDDSDEGLIFGDELITTNIVDSTLTLTTYKYQTTTMEDNTTIVLPDVSNYTEIHLFFSTESELTLILPSIKWQSDINIESGKTYEFIFTYTNEWLGGCVIYE